MCIRDRFNLVLTVIWFISGIRDLQGKDPFLDLPFNQYHRDPEYRAFWQKKNGVFYILNSIAFLILAFTPVTSLIYRCLLYTSTVTFRMTSVASYSLRTSARIRFSSSSRGLRALRSSRCV